jgi:4-carboxymuconolactone decarboxylase
MSENTQPDAPSSTQTGTQTDAQPIGHDMSATSQDVHDAGMAVRREVLGSAHVDRAESNKDETTEEFQNLITRYAWGTIWTRPGLDRRMRSAVTISAMVSGGYWEEAAMHIRAALRNGLSREEIKEILLQTAIYSSVPAANIAFKLAQEVFAQVDEDLAAGKEL